VARFTADLSRAMGAEAASTLGRVADVGVANQRALEHSVGHHGMAALWTRTPVVSDGRGGARTTIYSRAEMMTFYNRSGPGRARDPRFPVQGARLLAWLEGGVRPHVIEPRDPGGMLDFPARGGVEHRGRVRGQIFSGSFLDAGGLGVATFSGRGEAHVFARAVSHPGFAGNRFIAATRLMLQRALAVEGAAIARRIQARLR
jgi:hypothetical protein